MNTLSRVKSLLAALGLSLVAAISQAASGIGPYYATPSWDQTLPPSTRFVVLTNMDSEAVLDRETGLVWEKVPMTSTVFNWATASRHCLTLNLGGRKGWRLPTIQELASLVDPSQSNPALPSGHPFTVQSSGYWSASTYVDDTTDAWSAEFGNGLVIVLVKASSNFLAWCVRGGPGVDPQ